jgi:NAD(P)-dependent dehydrogenase (short-subunit alcohol dehydrogenase family)
MSSTSNHGHREDLALPGKGLSGNGGRSTLQFHRRAILVTGASTGIGRATARLVAERGARVFLVARREGLLKLAVKEIRDAGGEAAAHSADVSDHAALVAAIDAAETAFGPLEGLFANAGTASRFAPLGDYGDEDFEAVLRTNLFSPFWAIKRVLPGMIARRRGAIVVTGSLASHRGMAHNVGYVASKHGVLGLARAAALEAAPHNVRVNCVVPGFIDTPMLSGLEPGVLAALGNKVPQGRLGTSEETAEVVAFLLSEAARHVTGQSWAVDGGVLGTLAVS